MAKTPSNQYEPVSARPVKSFFVTMLTRDITLEEAILDLLDNCVDGILRSKLRDGPKPYQGYWAKIEFAADSFSISDNCGGIPWKLHEYAFRMGRDPDRPTDTPHSVGVYGIGMKRALFKMGKDCLISTQNGNDQYEVEIKPDWIADQENWQLPVRKAATAKDEDGTLIVVGELYPGIAKRFGEEAQLFQTGLETMISNHYAFIIDKGLKVTVNGDLIAPKPIRLIFDENAMVHEGVGILPFIFKTATSDGVEVFLTVGFTRPIPSQNEIVSEQGEKRYSSQDAGWTVLCNDRAVVFSDRTELTGWGEPGLPRFHTQFIAISGIVEFRSDDPSKLPTTTTKRGIDAASPLYLQIKIKMHEGLKIFTDYTNKWKGRAEESKKQIEMGRPLSLDEIKSETKRLTLATTKRFVLEGQQYKPNLPMPKRLDPMKRRISFTKDVDEVKAVAEYLFEDAAREPSEVGERCFDIILREAASK